jgi:hypothetical protein
LKSGGLVVANGKKGQLYQKEAANSRDANATKYGFALLRPSREAHIEIRRNGSYFSIFAVARRPASVAAGSPATKTSWPACRSSIS